MWALLQVGVLSIVGQVVLLRELNVASFGIELVYVVGIGIWLLATAAGAAVGGRRRRVSPSDLNALSVAFGVLVVAGLVFARRARLLFSGVPGAYLPIAQQLLVVAIPLIPLGLAGGALFQWAARRYVDRGRTLAAAYGIESLGGLAGGLGATALLSAGAPNLVLAELCPLLALATTGAGRFRRRPRSAAVLLAAVLAAGVWGFASARRVDGWMTGWTHPGLLGTRDLAYGRLAVAQREGQVSVFQNDALWFDTQSVAAETFAHVALLQHPGPRRVLVLGGGLEGLVRHALEHSPGLVEDVELDRTMFELVRSSLPGEDRVAFDHPAVRITFTDPRRFLRARRRFDAILVAAPEPLSGEANRFYTREFFRDCAASLDEDGILGFRLQSAENFWPPALAGRMLSIHEALHAVFPFTLVLPGSQNVFLASRVPLPSEPGILAARLAARRVEARLVSPGYLRYLYANDRRHEIARTLQSGGAVPNTDARPVCYRYAVAEWLSRFSPSVAALDQPDGDPFAGAGADPIAAAALVVLFGLARLVPGWRRPLLVGVAGLLGMVLETVLILHFQMKNGAVFRDLGMLLTSFMAGLAGGSLLVDRLSRGRLSRGPAARGLGAGLVGSLAVLSGLVAAAVARGSAGGLPAVLVLLAASGALVGGLFGWVSLRDEADRVSPIARLYAADVLGGCVGSLAAGLILVPVSGLAVTARLMVWVAAASAILL
jgi:spermidine synthase